MVFLQIPNEPRHTITIMCLLVNGDVRPIFVGKIRPSDKPFRAYCSPNHNFERRQLTFNRLHYILVERPKVPVLLLGDTITIKP